MIYWIIFFVAAIAVVTVLFVSFNKERKENRRMTDEISNLKLKVENLEQDKKSQEKVSEILKEIIFFSQLGYEPTKDEKRKMVDQLLDSEKYISDMNSKNSWFQTESALRESAKVRRAGTELSEVIKSLRNLLCESIAHNTSIYPQMTNFVRYCGFKFFGKEENPRSKIQEWGRVVNFGHVEE